MRVIQDLPSERSRRFTVPSLDGRHVYLRAVTPEDYRFLRLVETSSELAPRWRFRGSTPSPEEWAQMTWAPVLAQFMVVARRRNEAIGIVAAYHANFQDGFAYVAAARFDPRSRSPLMVLGVAVFLQYVFSCWDLRKLYLEVPEYNYPQLASGHQRIFEIEGRLCQHSFLGGELWDQLILAI
jgi:hypothetical protein